MRIVDKEIVIISQFFYKTEIYHIYFRKEIAAFINTKKSEDCLKYPHIIKNANEAIPYFDYFNELILTRLYAGEYELKTLY